MNVLASPENILREGSQRRPSASRFGVREKVLVWSRQKRALSVAQIRRALRGLDAQARTLAMVLLWKLYRQKTGKLGFMGVARDLKTKVFQGNPLELLKMVCSQAVKSFDVKASKARPSATLVADDHVQDSLKVELSYPGSPYCAR